MDLPDLKLFDIHAKIDTGAYSSSLHCHYVNEQDGQLEFVLLDDEHPEFTGMKFVFREYKIKSIRNSSGVMEQRYVIRTPVIIFGEEILTDFSLSFRESLRFPILLGRKILRKRFLVDVTKRNLSYRDKRKAKSASS